MIKIIGVRFREAGKIYYFSPGKRKISRGDQVIVETARGVEMGRVVLGEKEVPEEEIVSPLKEVTRIATEEDLKQGEREGGLCHLRAEDQKASAADEAGGG